jgi:AraC-like DNA-binding protein
MDVLGDILRIVRLRGSVYFNACFCSPWGMDVDASSKAAFHLVVRGSAWLKLAGQAEHVELKAGDIVLFPSGAEHVIADSPNSECLPGERVVDAYRAGEAPFGGEQEHAKIVCGYVEFDRSQSHPFLDNLPEMIHINVEQRARFQWLDSVIQQIVFESESGNPGADVLIDRFTEVLFIHVIRSYAEMSGVEKSYLSALTDNQLSKALSLIHDRAEKEWTVELLAAEVGMSRSAFYGRFNEYIGMPPMKYLFEWRMMQAKLKIESTQKSLTAVAEEVGYQSDSAFQKAFKRFFNFTPASLRKGSKNSL